MNGQGSCNTHIHGRDTQNLGSCAPQARLNGKREREGNDGKRKSKRKAKKNQWRRPQKGKTKRKEGKKKQRGCLYQLKHSLGDFLCLFQSTNRQFKRKTLEVLCVCVCVSTAVYM